MPYCHIAVLNYLPLIKESNQLIQSGGVSTTMTRNVGHSGAPQRHMTKGYEVWYMLMTRMAKHGPIVGLRPPPPPVVPTFFLLVSFTFLFEDFYYSVKEYKKISVCCSSG